MIRDMPPTIPKNKRTGDKYEFSPNALARCAACRQKIPKGGKRVGIEEYSHRYQRYSHRYYHDRCLSEPRRKRLKFTSGASFQEELRRQSQEKLQMQQLLRTRCGLRERLRQLRLSFANRLDKPAYAIFPNSTLDELTVKVPRNETEMMHVNGIGPMRFKNFGDPILHVIRLYHQEQRTATRRDNSAKEEPRTAARCPGIAPLTGERVSLVGASDDDVDGDTESIIMETLTCDEIVERKFRHAAENGYVISID